MLLTLTPEQKKARLTILFCLLLVFVGVYFLPTKIDRFIAGKEGAVSNTQISCPDHQPSEKDLKALVTRCKDKSDRRRLNVEKLVKQQTAFSQQVLLIRDRVRDLQNGHIKSAKNSSFWARITNVLTLLVATIFALFFSTGAAPLTRDNPGILDWILNHIPKPLIVIGIILAIPPTLGFHTKYAASSQAYYELRGLWHRIDSDIAVLALRVSQDPYDKENIKVVESRAFEWSKKLSEIEDKFGSAYSKNSPLLALPDLS